MHCLRLSDGRVTSVVGEMREQTVEFNTELCRAELCDPVCAQVLLADLPKLSLAQRDEINIPLLTHELAEAVIQMSTPAVHQRSRDSHCSFIKHSGE